MTIKKFALGGAAAVAFAGLLSATPAMAFTHHPATPAEIQETDALNAQSLANAQMGTKPNQPLANTGVSATGTTSGDVMAPSATTPDNNGDNATTPNVTPPATPPAATTPQ